MMKLSDTKVVPLVQWLNGLYSEGYEVRGYSEFGRDGVPKFVELVPKGFYDEKVSTSGNSGAD